MNFDFDAVMFLALFTIGAALVIGIVSRRRAKKAQDHHEDAAVAQRQRHEDAAPASAHGTPDEFTANSDSGRSWTKDRGANPPTPTTQTPPD